MSECVTCLVLERLPPLKTKTKKAKNWADHALAFLCRDMVMNQWPLVFNFSTHNDYQILNGFIRLAGLAGLDRLE